MRIGIIGTRGIPNHYGGYEQFAEFAGPELVRRGHEVYVYNSSLHPFQEAEWRGVKIISKYDPENRMGTAGQFIYDLNCIVDARKRNFDVILQLGYTSSSVWSFAFPRKALLVTNMDGLEWKRSKYSPRVQQFLKRAEKWAATTSDFLIADSPAIQKYLKEKYNKNSECIAYGAEIPAEPDPRHCIERDLKPGGYFLTICRMEPENNVETVIQGYLQSGSTRPLVLIGNEKNSYGLKMTAKYAHPNVRFFGAIYSLEVLNSLRRHAALYCHGHSVGGTNPSLLEAMASGVPIAAHFNNFNEAVLGQDALYFSTADDVGAIMGKLPEGHRRDEMIVRNLNKIRTEFSWNHIINKLETFLTRITNEQ